MEPAQGFDTLEAYQKLESAEMPEQQARATVEVVSEAMRNFVTREFFTAELDRRFGKVDQRFTKLEAKVGQRFTKLEAKVDQRFANLGEELAKSRKTLLATIVAIVFGALTMQFALLGLFGFSALNRLEAARPAEPVEITAPAESPGR